MTCQITEILFDVEVEFEQIWSFWIQVLSRIQYTMFSIPKMCFYGKTYPLIFISFDIARIFGLSSRQNILGNEMKC